MPLHQIADVAYHLAHRAKTVFPFWMQEPTIEPRLADILANIKCYAPRTETCIYSNMAHYPADTWKTILETGTLDKLVISFFGTDKQTYSKLQQPLNFNQTRRNIKKLWRLRAKLGWTKPEIKIRLLITPETASKARRFHKTWSPYADVVCGTYLESWDTDPAEVLKFNRKVWGKPAPRVPCARLYNSVNIACNGDVSMCCMDYNITERLGNVFEDGYDLWWNNKRLQTLRQLHEQGNWDSVPLCRKCTIYAYNHSKEWIQHWMNNKEYVAYAISR